MGEWPADKELRSASVLYRLFEITAAAKDFEGFDELKDRFGLHWPLGCERFPPSSKAPTATWELPPKKRRDACHLIQNHPLKASFSFISFILKLFKPF